MEPSETTIDSLKDDNIEDILLRLPSPASLARAALASSRWRGIASSPPFLRRFRDLHPWSPVLGLFVSHSDLEQLPIFHPAASVRSDPDLAAAARRSDFLLTRLERDPAWRFRDCRDGRLLLCRGDSLSVYDPVSHRHVAVPRPPYEDDDEILALLVQGAAAEYVSDCLLDGHGGEGFRVVTVQRDGQRMRAMEYDSRTGRWRIHPWVDGIGVPAQRTRPMHAAAAGLIFWKFRRNSSLLLDTSTMAFSIVVLPAALEILNPMRPARAYAIGDTEAGGCCLLVFVSPTTLQVWLLKENGDGGGHAWELEKQSQMEWLAGFNRRFTVHMDMVAAGLAIVSCARSKFSHFVIDLKDLSLKDKFRCHRSMVFPFQMPWPPAALRPAQTYACRDAENRHGAPSSSRKRKTNDEMASGEETTEPCISIASLQNESSEKKFCYEKGTPS